MTPLQRSYAHPPIVSPMRFGSPSGVNAALRAQCLAAPIARQDGKRPLAIRTRTVTAFAKPSDAGLIRRRETLMSTKLPLTVCLIAGAEAHRISRALESVAGWTQEIVVVLNADVTDGTDDVARKHGAQVFREPWCGFVKQKASATAKASQQWILGLDADEVVTPELRAEIERTISQGSHAQSAYSFPRCTFFCGRWIRHGDWYPDRVTRLWKEDSATWAGIDPHANLEVRGEIGQLRSDLLHYPNETIDRQLAKITSYSEDFLRDAQRTGRPSRVFDLAFRPGWRFLRSYIFRLGFLDGWQGYYIAWMTAFYTVTRYAKVREAQQTASRASGG